MNVLMTADTVGGVWTYVIELTRALPDVTFTLATMGRLPTNAQRAEVPGNVSLAENEYRLEWQENPWNDVAHAAEWLLGLEDRAEPDLIHLNGFSHGVLPFRAPTLVVGHSCVLSWWRAVHGHDAPRAWTQYREQVARGLAGADLVAAPSAWMLAALDEHYRFKTPRRLIYNGRTSLESSGRSHRFGMPQAGDEHTKAVAAATALQTVFAAGRLWDEAKNLRTVLEAAPSIAWPVRIAGDGGEAHTTPNVTHLGRLDQDQMAQAYAESGIYLFPALYEPFGLSVLEAALSGCALILGDIPSLREIWRDAAVFVPPRDAETIARVTNEVIANDEFREELSRRAQHRALEFTPQRMADGYRAAYAELTAGVKAEAS
jgi:glycogen synthase